jgi:hypothetical protein
VLRADERAEGHPRRERAADFVSQGEVRVRLLVRYAWAILRRAGHLTYQTFAFAQPAHCGVRETWFSHHGDLIGLEVRCTCGRVYLSYREPTASNPSIH